MMKHKRSTIEAPLLRGYDALQFSLSQIMETLQTSPKGLSADQVEQYHQRFGMNELPQPSRDTLLKIFLRQFVSPLMLVLVVAVGVTFALGEIVDGGIILFVLLVNGIIGTFQEGRAQSVLESLRTYSSTESVVLRAGQQQIIPSQQLVVGDVVILREGDKTPADIRLIEAHNFAVDESLLTGESISVEKQSKDEASSVRLITEAKHAVFRGTHCTRGQAVGVVTSIGIDTEIGKISRDSAHQEEIPLQKSLRLLAQYLVIGTLGIIIALFFIGLGLGIPLQEMILVSVSLMVSVVPEGLPIVMTLILALGVQRMSKHYVLVKKMQAVEALGHATILALDKTGTLTKNELTVTRVMVDNSFFRVAGLGWDSVGLITSETSGVTNDQSDYLLKRFAMSADARIFYDEQNNVTISGDPTEASLIILGKKRGFEKEALLTLSPQIERQDFDYQKKYYTQTIQEDGALVKIFVGAPEVLLGFCVKLRDVRGGVHDLNDQKREMFLEQVRSWANEGLRVIACIEQVIKDTNDDKIHDGIFLGMCAMQDVLREEVYESVRLSQEAGIKVVMITGDHVIAATALARQAGIYRDGDEVLTGQELMELSDEVLMERMKKVSVFARVVPEHKLRIINLYKKCGETVAMTGDGVNDVPSLTAAHLGVAMGKKGTEVAKDSADLVLLDDNFGNIPRAVKEGRIMFATIQKTLVYLLSTNFSELLLIGTAIIFVLPSPLLPAQIVWLNLVTDSFLVLTLAFVSHEPPRLLKKSLRFILDQKTFGQLILFGLIIFLGTFLIYRWGLAFGEIYARTMVLVTLSLFQIFRLWSVRADHESVYVQNPFRFPWMMAGSIMAILLVVGVVHIPLLQDLLQTSILDRYDWMLAVVTAFSIIAIDEVRKSFFT